MSLQLEFFCFWPRLLAWATVAPSGEYKWNHPANTRYKIGPFLMYIQSELYFSSRSMNKVMRIRMKLVLFKKLWYPGFLQFFKREISHSISFQMQNGFGALNPLEMVGFFQIIQCLMPTFWLMHCTVIFVLFSTVLHFLYSLLGSHTKTKSLVFCR